MNTLKASNDNYNWPHIQLIINLKSTVKRYEQSTCTKKRYFDSPTLGKAINDYVLGEFDVGTTGRRWTHW